MKKLFGILITACFFISCDNETENTEVTDSIIIKTDTSVVVPPDTTLVTDTAIF